MPPAAPPSRPAGGGFARVALRVLLLIFFVLGFALLGLREFVLPRADTYRDWVSERLTELAGTPVRMDALEAEWPGLVLRVRAHGLRVGEGDSALLLKQVEADLGWSSLLRGEPYLRRVRLLGPELTVVREPDGRLRVAGVSLDGAPADGGGLAAWLARQGEVELADARLSWDDRLRGAPVLDLREFGLRVERVGARYRFGLQGRPDAGVARGIDVRGDLVGDDLTDVSRWHGQLYMAIDEGRLEGLAPWIDYPFAASGVGALKAWMGVEGGKPHSLTVQFALRDFGARLDPALPALEGAEASGRVTAVRDGDTHRVELRGFAMQAGEALRIEPTDVDVTFGPAGGALELSVADVGELVVLSDYLPMPESVRQRLDAHAPSGRVEALRLTWSGDVHEAALTGLQARLHGLSMRPHGNLPGVRGLDGEVAGDAASGRFAITRVGALDVPRVLVGGEVPFDAFEAEGGWAAGERGTEVRITRARFANPDTAGELQGTYRPAAGALGDIDLTARLNRAEGARVWRYVPSVVGDTTREWVRKAIVAARVGEARLSLRGPLDAFPFVDGEGEFVVTVELDRGRLDYAPGWPAIDDITASLRFEGPGLRITASQGRILGARLRDVVAELPDLNIHHRRPMTLHGRAEGETAEFLRFVSESPVRGQVAGFTDGMAAEGLGVLDLALVMPLHAPEHTEVRGRYDFADNRITVTDGLPPVEQAAGSLSFTEDSFGIEQARGQVFGAPVSIQARTESRGRVRFDVRGGALARSVAAHYDWPVLRRLSGRTDWQAVVTVAEGVTRVVVQTTLENVSSSLPAPLNKRAGEARPARVEVVFDGERRDISGEIGKDLRFALRGHGTMEDFRVERGAVAVGRPLSQPARGLALAVTTDALDVDAWRALAEEGATERAPLPWSDLDLRAARLRAFDYDLQDFELVAVRNDSAWGGRVASDLIAGGFAWHEGDKGTLALRLEHLRLGRRDAVETELVRVLREEAERTTLPDMDVVAEHFYLNDRDLGRLDLQARNDSGEWLIDSVTIASEDAQLSARGRWIPKGQPRTQLAVRLEAVNLGNFLGRMGYPDTVRRGTALLTGELEWQGVPTRMDYPSLDGRFRVEARSGRFAQLEPGVGRLLGVLSLQALPRRLVLDFRDVFSEGFTFDLIAGDVSMKAGVLSTEELAIAGPAAKVWIGGTADVLHETHDLKVVVQPTLTESVAVGTAAGLVNPVAGLIAYLAQKAFNDPFERLFAYGYAITGRWDDPQIEKLPVGRGRQDVEEVKE